MLNSSTFGKLSRYVLDGDYRFRVNSGKFGLYRWLSDEAYLKRQFKAMMGYELDTDNPKTFNEKLQWLKLHDRKPIYTSMVDKCEAKKYVASIIGDQYIIPTLGVWDRFEDIDFNALPDQFVLKCTHDSGGLVICRDKSKLDLAQAKAKINKSLRQNYFYRFREWPYKDVKPRILAEEYMVDESHRELKDYKIFVFNGKAKYIQVDYDRFTDHHRNFYDTEWEYVPFTLLYPTNPDHLIQKPDGLKQMIDIAEHISARIEKPPFVRVDLYYTEKGIYFGEVTFYHGSGYEPFDPVEYDYKLGEMIRIR